MAKFTTKEYGSVVEKSLLAEARRLYIIYTEKSFRCEHEDELVKQLSHILQLITVWIDWKDGVIVGSPVDISSVGHIFDKNVK